MMAANATINRPEFEESFCQQQQTHQLQKQQHQERQPQQPLLEQPLLEQPLLEQPLLEQGGQTPGRRGGWRRWVGLGVGMAQLMVSGSVFAFPAYSSCLRASFRLSQTQTSLLPSMASLGLLSSLPTGWLMDRGGARVPVLLALALSVSGFGLLYSSTFNPEFYHAHSSLLCLYYFIAGAGAIMPTVINTLFCGTQFDPRYCARVMGVLGACFNLGPTVGSAVYSTWFVNGHVTDEANQNLRGFFGMSAIAFAVVNVMEVVFVWSGPSVHTETSQAVSALRRNGEVQNDRVTSTPSPNCGLRNTSEEIASAENDPSSKFSVLHSCSGRDAPLHGSINVEVSHENETGDESTRLLRESPSDNGKVEIIESRERVANSCQMFLELLKSTQFHFLAWPYIFSACLQMMLMANVGSILQSLELQKYTPLVTTVGPLVSTVCKPFLGTLSDVVVKVVPRPAVVVVTASLQTVMLVVFFFKGDNFPVVMTAMLAVHVANAATWVMTVTMTGEYMGTKWWGRAWGLMDLGPALGGLLVMKIFGLLYDRQVAAPALTCLGTRCFSSSLLVAATLSACSVILHVGLLELRVRLERQLGRR